MDAPLSSSPLRVLSYRLPMLRGDDVRTIQRRLAALGYGREVGADGLFGPNTRAAVQDFQRAHGLVVDGTVDADTRALLASADARPRGAAPSAIPTPVRRPPPSPGLAETAPAPFLAAPPPPAPKLAEPALIPLEWLPRARPERIICHWTAGAYDASDLDRQHYHFLIEGDGTVRRGRHAVSANDRPLRGAYAPHTRGKNTGSIGVAVCCMAGAHEHPFDPGRFPMRREQWRRMAAVVAQLCVHYGIAVTPRTVLGHGEVEHRLQVPQRAKWDPLALPWQAGLDLHAAGERFREEVRALTAAPEETAAEAEPPVHLATELDGAELSGTLDFDCAARLSLEALGLDPRFTVAEVDDDEITLVFEDRAPLYLAWDTPPGTVPDPALPAAEAARLAGFVSAEEVAAGLGLEIALRDGKLELARPRVPATVDPDRFEPVVLGPGDTLRTLAARHLGDAARWDELRDRAGGRFDAARARALAVGTTVLLPRSDDASSPIADAELAGLVAAARPWHREWAKEAIVLLVTGCRAGGLGDPAQIAYVLATAEHESHFGRAMVEEGDAATWRAYEGRQGNDRAGDGKRYRGRGYVRLTFKANYAAFADRLGGVDLVAAPERAAEPEIAARIAVVGMRDGLFRGERLAEHVGAEHRDFVAARRVVGDDHDRRDPWDDTATPRGPRVAARAERFLEALGRATLTPPV
ncbi:MAG: peptidoglycan-binding protein [Alphaproteobacteria bacterium]|jgi:N-acetyl-anhydromuramyl-L-alanine amidase AmpD|nr:peptidoglycan-binding protein [Alphaproteobacteria bacterium]